jgi:putative colanic acid biosynthesis UDP-glucose lipid carrier transferase
MKDSQCRKELRKRQSEIGSQKPEAERNIAQMARYRNVGLPDARMFHFRSSPSPYGGDVNGNPATSVCEGPLHGPNGSIKRTEDLILSGLILLAISPLMPFMALGVKLSSPGPVFFTQRRYGLDGKEIMVSKFRTMTVCEDGVAIPQAKKNDQRVTRFGAFLSKTSLDELPQFINVLQGSMSIVGPRPHAVAHNEYYRRIIPDYMLRHKVKPGITGWAQVNGWRGETDTIEKMAGRVQFDLDYMKYWSFWFDVKIIFKTLLKGFTDKNAY